MECDAMSVFFGKCRSLTQDKKTKIGKLGNWMAITLECNDKKLVMIGMHGMPRTSSNGDCCSLVQCNEADGKVKTTNEYGKEAFDQSSNLLMKQKTQMTLKLQEISIQA